jgi:hypothetical protein
VLEFTIIFAWRQIEGGTTARESRWRNSGTVDRARTVSRIFFAERFEDICRISQSMTYHFSSAMVSDVQDLDNKDYPQFVERLAP